jgi:hypothetical protein
VVFDAFLGKVSVIVRELAVKRSQLHVKLIAIKSKGAANDFGSNLRAFPAQKSGQMTPEVLGLMCTSRRFSTALQRKRFRNRLPLIALCVNSKAATLFLAELYRSYL